VEDSASLTLSRVERDLAPGSPAQVTHAVQAVK
jgi:hypothetical protein